MVINKRQIEKNPCYRGAHYSKEINIYTEIYCDVCNNTGMSIAKWQDKECFTKLKNEY